MNVWGYMLKLAGWTVDITAPRRDKCVICVAPHTSNMDFILGLSAYRSLGRKANFLMKKFWFFFPMKYLLKSLGGIPVDRRPGGSGLTSAIVEMFGELPYLNLAVTPEGTRSRQPEWHTGFLRIADEAGVPVQLGVIDYRDKRIIIRDELHTSGDTAADLERVKKFYSGYAYAAKYPDKFATK